MQVKVLLLSILIASKCFGQGSSAVRDFKFVTDSLVRKHCKQSPIVFSIKSDMAISGFFFYKKGKKWRGFLVNDASLVNQESQFVHSIRIKAFDADTSGRRLISLGIEELKQYSNKELTEYYNAARKRHSNSNVEYDLPLCMDGGVATVNYKRQLYTYADCVYSDTEIMKLPEMKRFYEIARYLQTVLYPSVSKV